MATVSVRYIVTNVDEAIAFYCAELGFREDMHPAPTFAMLSRGDLRLVLSAPGGDRAEAVPCPTGRCQNRAVGTGSRLRCRISQNWSRPSAGTAPISETTS